MQNKARLQKVITDGTAIIFSDCHYWPGIVTTAHRGLIRLCERLQPKLVIANGDVMDGARISKHQRIGWDNAPKVSEELETCSDRLREIMTASDAELVWCLGNHDARFETFLANNVGEYAGVPGFTLKEHFPEWQPCWSCHINGEVRAQHRWKGGKTATLKNTMESGMTIATGHLHSLRVSPYTDFRGTRFGIDTGTLADPYGPQFVNYTEDTCVDWRSGLIALTFKEGRLLWPEEAYVSGPGKLTFRGEEFEV